MAGLRENVLSRRIEASDQLKRNVTENVFINNFITN